MCLEFPDENGPTFYVGDRKITGRAIISAEDLNIREIELGRSPNHPTGLDRLKDEREALEYIRMLTPEKVSAS